MRYHTDDRCPMPRQTDAERRTATRALWLIWTAVAVSVVLGALSAFAATTNVYWRVTLNQGSGPIAYGQGATSEAAWLDCYRLQETTRAMTAAETRRYAVGAVTQATVRWCSSPVRYATMTPDVVPVNCVVSAWSTWTAGPWSTCTSGQQSRAETHTRTVTTQPSNGGTACPALTETRTVTQACSSGGTGTTLSWTAPTHNDDGSLLTNLAGFTIHYGTQGGTPYTTRVSNPSARSYTLAGLAADDWHFCVRAYNTEGRDSACSNVITRTVR